MYVLFDSFAMYSKGRVINSNIENAKNILYSDPIANLVSMLRNCKDRCDMNDLFELI